MGPGCPAFECDNKELVDEFELACRAGDSEFAEEYKAEIIKRLGQESKLKAHNHMSWQERETEAFAKTLKLNKNTGNCPVCGFNIDLDIAMYNCGKIICDSCFLKEQELERLKEMTKQWSFPLHVSFHLTRSKYGTQSISFAPVRNKSKLENLKFNNIRLLPLDGSRMAVITVERVENIDELKLHIDKLSEFWC